MPEIKLSTIIEVSPVFHSKVLKLIPFPPLTSATEPSSRPKHDTSNPL